VPNFVAVAASIAELAHEEKSRTQSINQSPNLLDVLGTEAFVSEFRHILAMLAELFA